MLSRQCNRAWSPRDGGEGVSGRAGASKSLKKRGSAIARVAPKEQDSTVASTSGRPSDERETGAALKAVWYAAELFGKAVGQGKNQGSTKASHAAAASQALSRDEVIRTIRDDYKKNYFVTGLGEMEAYDDNCVFADPFVSFKGTSRFKQNVGNLGGMMRDIKLDVYSFKEEGEDRVETKWRFSCILDLPWKPLLAAAGGTTHVIDLGTGKVVKHIEAWDVEPGKVVKQLFRPTAKVPTNSWETLLMAVDNNDPLGIWLSLSPTVLRITLPVIGVSLLCKAFTGEGLPGVILGGIEGFSYLGALSAVVTEGYKLVKGMEGGESG